MPDNSQNPSKQLRICTFINPGSNERCKGTAQNHNDFCPFHDPEKIEIIKNGRAKGGHARMSPRKTLAPDLIPDETLSPENALRLIQTVTKQAATGEIDLKLANTINSLLRTQILLYPMVRHSGLMGMHDYI